MRLCPQKYDHLSGAISDCLEYLMEYGTQEKGNYWQAQKIISEDFKPYEVANVIFEALIPNSVEELAQEVNPNTEWANEQFNERVSGKPLNPMPSYIRWPFWSPESSKFSLEVNNNKFSHTYAERFWPKAAGSIPKGIRYPCGDLNDVVKLLIKDPYTRQAYFPIWMSEDTGAVSSQRVPCSLGYHFMMRSRKLNIYYTMRSTDALRYLRDDIYLAARLNLWMLSRLSSLDPVNWAFIDIGTLIFHTYSLHVFKADLPILKLRIEQLRRKLNVTE